MSRTVFRAPFAGHSTSVRGLGLFSILCVLALVCEAKPKAPSWLQEAMARTSPVTGDAKAVIIEDSSRITHKSSNRVEGTTRFAVRIFDKEERGRASVEIGTMDDHHKIRGFKAWMVYPSGRIEEFKESDTVDVAADLDSLRSEAKVKILNRSRSVRPGCVFAYEYSSRRKTVFVQHDWRFQSRVPSLYSRLELQVPKAWTASAVTFNDSGRIKSGVSNGIYFWETRDLPGIAEEPHQRPLSAEAVRIAVRAIPTAKEQARYGYLGFDDWNGVAKWDAEVNEAPTKPTASIIAKAQSLVAEKTSQWEKIQAICDFSQTVNYLAVSIDLSQGGGFEPRPASEVLQTHWGDCKDMSALTVSLLDAVGIKAYTVGACIGEDAYVAREWPAPEAFNHCIVAIPLDQSVSGSAVVQTSGLGRVVIFDPTIQDTPVGELPGTLFDGRVLIGSEATTDLLDLPVAQPSDRRLVRMIEASLDPQGTLQATVREELRGMLAAYLRRVVRTSSEEELEDFVRNWISTGAPRAEIEDISVTDDFRNGRFSWEIRFSAGGFARSMAGATLFAFKPVFLSALQWVPPEEEERTTDYISHAWLIEERIRFELPEGFALENLPAAQSLDRIYGKYSLKSSEEDGVAVVERTFETRSTITPPDQYRDLVDFYLQIHRSDSAQIVLKANSTSE